MPIVTIPIIDSPIRETSDWLFSASLYLDEMEKAVGEARKRYREEILLHARKRNSPDPYSEHYELDELENEIIPGFYRVLTYSFTSLLHSITENQLNALARELRVRREIDLRLKEVTGKGIRRARLYLSRTAGLDVAKDSAWKTLLDLSELRNIIVHRGGQQGPKGKPRETVEALLARYAPELSLSGSSNTDYAEIVITPALCRQFLVDIRDFFGRVFKEAKLSGLEMYGWSESA